MEISSSAFDKLARLWDEVEAFPLSDAAAANSYLMKTLADWLEADYAYWCGLVRMADLSLVSMTNSGPWYENTDGEGTFGAQRVIIDSLYTEFAVNVRDIDVGDIDGDGDLDVVASSITDSSVAWWSNDGLGNFGIPNLITEQSSVGLSVELVDFDNDGDLDVIANGDGVDRYRNDGTGTFTAAGNFTFALDFFDTADFDGDNVVDVVASDPSNNSITLQTASTSGTVSISNPGGRWKLSTSRAAHAHS